jgi:hypothetical protein
MVSEESIICHFELYLLRVLKEISLDLPVMFPGDNDL